MTINRGRIAIVTGAAQGIGYGIAERLARDGYTVAGTDRNGLAMAEAVKRLAAAGLAIRGEALDVRDRKSAHQFIESLPRVDVLVNNAGIFKDAEFEDLTESDFAEVYEVNVTGAAIMAQEALRKMQSGARIINIASRAFLGARRHAHYAASKAGVVGLTRAMAVDLMPRGIHVNAIAPGMIETPALNLLSPERRAQVLAQQPTGKAGKPADIANAVAFFAAAETDFITGQVLLVDGGKSLGGLGGA